MLVPNPGYALRFKKNGKPHIYSYNKAGFRGNCIFKQDKKNILILGDSFVDNLLSDELLFERMLNARQSAYNFINAGIAGSSNIQQIEYLKGIILEHANEIGEILLFIYIGNDLIDNMNPLTGPYLDGNFDLKQDRQHAPLLGYTALYFLVKYFSEYKKVLKDIRNIQIQNMSFSEKIDRTAVESQMEYIVNELKGTCIPFRIFLIPTVAEIAEHTLFDEQRKYAEMFALYRIWAEEYLASGNIPVLDLYGRFAKDPRREDIYDRENFHFSEYGERALSVIVGEYYR